MSNTLAYPMKQFQLPNGMRFWNAPESGRETKFIYREIFEERCYEKHGVTITDGDVVFDVGANIGMFARSLMDRFHDLQLYCFEPVPNTRSCLERNIAECPDRSRHLVTVLDVAVGAKEYQTTIDFFPSAPGNSTLYPEEKKQEFNDIADELRIADLWKAKKGAALLALLLYPFRRWLFRRISEKFLGKAKPISCQVRTISNVIRERGVQRIDLLKVDVEGAEMDALAGIEDEHWPLIRQLAVEVAPANKHQIAMLSNRLQSLAFSRIVVENMLGGNDDLNLPGPCTVYAVREA
jgi:phthiocerol/phenolphthiocerol synthesis type-I polyketide synthase E